MRAVTLAVLLGACGGGDSEPSPDAGGGGWQPLIAKGWTLMPGGEKPHLPAMAGMLVGFAGAGLLLAPDSSTGIFDRELLIGFLILQLGSAAWTSGSLFQRRQQVNAHPVIIGAVQQVAAGLAFLAPALVVPHGAVQWNERGIAALLYLVTFGSIVGYSAYVYALDRLPVSIVSIYPYVNAVVAVALGWLFYREPFGSRQATAMLVIFLGVWLVKRFSPSGRSLRPKPRPPYTAREEIRK